ncbi:MAG: sugar transferase, partial [Wenzhouxiangellaceae bacterium]
MSPPDKRVPDKAGMMYRHIGKRILDLVLASAATLLLLPPMVVIIALIKATDPGPVFFIQSRVGRDGRQFRLYKFRSMPVDTGDLPSSEVGEIPMSWVGRFVRRTNFD